MSSKACFDEFYDNIWLHTIHVSKPLSENND